MSGGGDWVSTSMPYLTRRDAGQPDAWAEEAAAQGRTGTQRILSAGEAPASAEVGALLGVAAGQPVVFRRRVIELDGAPNELTDTYYPVEIAARYGPGRDGEDPGRRGDPARPPRARRRTGTRRRDRPPSRQPRSGRSSRWMRPNLSCAWRA